MTGTLERFWRRVAVGDPDECWEWQGARTPKGYGLFAIHHSRNVRAHRFALEVTTGERIPGKLMPDHLCRNPPCCNPAHLEVVTGRENLLRGNTLAAENAALIACRRGHPFTPENTYRDRRGSRHCRTCQRIRHAERRMRGARGR